MKRYGSVYLIINKENNKKYIGITTTSLKSRWASHCAPSTTCTYIKNAILKYGKDNFLIEEIYISFIKEDLEEKELYFILNLNTLAPNGYNLTLGKGFKGKQSDITCEKKSISHKNWWKVNNLTEIANDRRFPIKKYIESKRTPIISVNISTGMLNRYISQTHTPFLSKTINQALKDPGKSHNCYWYYDNGESDNFFIKKTLDRLNGEWRPENENPLLAIAVNGLETRIYQNAYDARKDGFDVTAIRQCLKGYFKQTKGFKFQLLK